jgi:hypothetical protein
MSPVIYKGTRTEDGTLRVTKQIDDMRPKPLDPRFDLRRHSPTGMECGYMGSGCAQLALAITADVLGELEAEDVYQKYKSQVVAALPRSGFAITAESVEEWAKGLREKEAKEDES